MKLEREVKIQKFTLQALNSASDQVNRGQMDGSRITL